VFHDLFRLVSACAAAVELAAAVAAARRLRAAVGTQQPFARAMLAKKKINFVAARTALTLTLYCHHYRYYY
jgi:hypothetical protein